MTMTFLPFLHFFALITYAYLLIYVLYKNPKALYNRVLALFIGSFIIWSFGKIFVHSPSSSRETANLFEDIASFGWISFGSFYLWAAIVFIDDRKLLRSKFLYLLALPSLFFFYKQWTGLLLVDHIRQPYGWSNVWSDSVWPYLFYLYYIIFMGTGLWMLYGYWKTGRGLKGKQAGILFISTLFVLVAGTATDVILPEARIHGIPELADVFVLVWVFGAAYAIAKYKYLRITPELAAENIISVMPDALILLDKEGKIVFVNSSSEKILNYGKKELLRKNGDMIFSEGDIEKYWFDRIMMGEDLRNCELSLKTKDGGAIPVAFSSTTLRDDSGEVVGKVLIASDISKIKEAENEIMQSNKKYRELYEGSRDGYSMVDMQGHIIETNKAYREMFGYSPKELRSITYNDITPEKWRPFEKKIIEEQVMKRGYSEVYEKEGIKKDGTVFPIELRAYLIRDDATGQPAAMWAYVRDITERKAAEEEIAKKMQQLESFKNMTVEREMDMVKLKEKIKELNRELGGEEGAGSA